MVGDVKKVLISWLIETNAFYFYAGCFEDYKALILDFPSVPRLSSHGLLRSASARENIGENTTTEYHCRIYNSFITSFIESLKNDLKMTISQLLLQLKTCFWGNIYTEEDTIMIQELYISWSTKYKERVLI